MIIIMIVLTSFDKLLFRRSFVPPIGVVVPDEAPEEVLLLDEEVIVVVCNGSFCLGFFFIK